MTVGDWTPVSALHDQPLDEAWLKKCVTLSDEDSLESMAELLSEQEIREKAVYMKLPPAQWQAAVATFSNEEIVSLIRFFTRAEMLLSGWEAGKDSPAITLNKVLRQRGDKLSKQTLRWIRENTDNRFIPNGGL